MIKRTLELSRHPSRISVRHGQLQVKQGDELIGSIPCEDIGVVLADHPGNTYTQSALGTLTEAGAAVLFCGADHLPSAMLLPLSSHTEVVWRVDDQLSAKKPLKKRLWKQLIQEKIRGQADNLSEDLPEKKKLLKIADGVKSGDTRNAEAHAARVYWSCWLGSVKFKRNTEPQKPPEDSVPNAFLNYGYAVLRAAIGRAVVAAGLLPMIGLHHRHRSNAFCLVDDLIEPLRPMVDFLARELVALGKKELDREAKETLLGMLTIPVSIGQTRGPLMSNIHKMVSSLVRCYQGEATKLDIPKIIKEKNESNEKNGIPEDREDEDMPYM